MPQQPSNDRSDRQRTSQEGLESSNDIEREQERDQPMGDAERGLEDDEDFEDTDPDSAESDVDRDDTVTD